MSSEGRQWRRLAVDVAVALAAFAFTLGLVFGPDRDPDETDAGGLAFLLAALSTLPLVGRRASPVGVLVLVTLASSLLFGLGYPQGPPIGPAVALFYLGLSGARVGGSMRLTLSLLAGLFLVHITASGIGEGYFPAPQLLFAVPFWFAAWLRGDRT
jgi:hypothetical protein